MLCDYGCGQEALFQFKNGKWCCSKNQNTCPSMKEKNRVLLCGENNPNYGKTFCKETRKKMSESHKKRKIPFEIIYRLIENENYLLITTKEEYNKLIPKIKLKCPKNHSFSMRIDCFKDGQRCPQCSRKIVSQKNKERMNNGAASELGNKLRTSFEEIKNFVSNEGYLLLSNTSDYKNWFSYLKFKCPKGHIFQKRYDGFVTGYRCRKCDNELRRKRMLNGGAAYLLSFVKNPSKPQIELFSLVKSLYPSAALNYACLNFSIDIVIPELKIAIEYDGEYWHKNKEVYDNKRQHLIEEKGWTFIRYREYVPSIIELKRDISQNLNN